MDLPKRRTSVARPGGGSMIGLQAEGPLHDEGDNDTLPASPDFLRQTSEAELLDATVNLGVVSARPTTVQQCRPLSFSTSPYRFMIVRGIFGVRCCRVRNAFVC